LRQHRVAIRVGRCVARALIQQENEARRKKDASRHDHPRQAPTPRRGRSRIGLYVDGIGLIRQLKGPRASNAWPAHTIKSRDRDVGRTRRGANRSPTQMPAVFAQLRFVSLERRALARRFEYDTAERWRRFGQHRRTTCHIGCRRRRPGKRSERDAERNGQPTRATRRLAPLRRPAAGLALLRRARVPRSHNVSRYRKGGLRFAVSS
jgi:hypothetical protein